MFSQADMLELSVFRGLTVVTTNKVAKCLKESHSIFFVEIQLTFVLDSQCVETWRQILPQVEPNNLFQERRLLIALYG